MDKYRPPSPYIEYVLRCSLTGRDPNPDEKRYERMQFWGEIFEHHAKSTEAALRMSQELETAIRQAAKECNDEEVNKEINATKIRKENES
jgi:hypothetical protein